MVTIISFTRAEIREFGRFFRFLLDLGSDLLNLSLVERMFESMDWSLATADEIDRGFDQFGGLHAASAAELCVLIQAADVGQSWMTDGARSLTDWVAARLRVRHPTAAHLVSVARRLQDLPVLSARFASGDLSLDQVDAISKMASVDTEEGLIEEALGLSNLALDGMARRSAPRSTEDERTVWERRRLVRQWNLDESELRFHGNLSAAEGKMFDQAIDDRVNVMGPNPETGFFDLLETRSADALVELAVTTGDQTVSLPQMTVFADLDALTSQTVGVAELSNTALIPNETARRLSCDCVLETVVTDGSVIVGVGRNSRTIPGWLRRLINHRDGGRCQWVGCRNTRWLQVHHIQHWSQGGTTDLDNLILLCGFHHRFVHENGWHITGDPNDRVVFRRPDWTPFPGPASKLAPRLHRLLRPT
jgi:hypothetical protein